MDCMLLHAHESASLDYSRGIYGSAESRIAYGYGRNDNHLADAQWLMNNLG